MNIDYLDFEQPIVNKVELVEKVEEESGPADEDNEDEETNRGERSFDIYSPLC